MEISGSAYGVAQTVDAQDQPLEKLFERGEGRERSFHRVFPHQGQRIRFVNQMQEQPIGDFSVFHVVPGKAPEDDKRLTYTLHTGFSRDGGAALDTLSQFIT